MFKHYWTTALRNLMRSKLFTFINIIGLSLSIAIFLALSGYVTYQTRFIASTITNTRKQTRCFKVHARTIALCSWYMNMFLKWKLLPAYIMRKPTCLQKM